MGSWSLIEAHVRDHYDQLQDQVSFSSYLPVVVVLTISVMALFFFRVFYLPSARSLRPYLTTSYLCLGFITMAWFQGCSSSGRGFDNTPKLAAPAQEKVFVHTAVGQGDVEIQMKPGEALTRTYFAPAQIAFVTEQSLERSSYQMLEMHPSVPSSFFSVTGQSLRVLVSQASKTDTSVLAFRSNQGREYAVMIHGPLAIAKVFQDLRAQGNSKDEALDQIGNWLKSPVSAETVTTAGRTEVEVKVFKRENSRSQPELVAAVRVPETTRTEESTSNSVRSLKGTISEVSVAEDNFVASPQVVAHIENFILSETINSEAEVEPEPIYPEVANYKDSLGWTKIILWNGFNPAEAQLQQLYTWAFSTLPRVESTYCSDLTRLGCDQLDKGLPLIGSNPVDPMSFLIASNPVFNSQSPQLGLGSHPKIGKGFFLNTSSAADMSYADPLHNFRKADEAPVSILQMATEFYNFGAKFGLTVGGAYVLGKTIRTRTSKAVVDVSAASATRGDFSRTAVFQNASAAGGIRNLEERSAYVGLLSFKSAARAEAVLREFQEAYKKVAALGSTAPDYRFAPSMIAKIQDYTGVPGVPPTAANFGLGMDALEADEQCSQNGSQSKFAEAHLPEIPAEAQVSHASFVRCLFKFENGSGPKPRGGVFSWMSDPNKFVFARPEGGGVVLYFNMLSGARFTNGTQSYDLMASPWELFWILRLRSKDPSLFRPFQSISQTLTDPKMEQYADTRSLFPIRWKQSAVSILGSSERMTSYSPREYLNKIGKLSLALAQVNPQGLDAESKLRPSYLERDAGDLTDEKIRTLSDQKVSAYARLSPSDTAIAQFEVGTNEVAEYVYDRNRANTFPNGIIKKSKAHLLTCAYSDLFTNNSLENFLNPDFEPQFYQSGAGGLSFGWTQYAASSCGGRVDPSRVFIGRCQAILPVAEECPGPSLPIPAPVVSQDQGEASSLVCPGGTVQRVEEIRSSVSCDTSNATIAGLATDEDCPRVQLSTPRGCTTSCANPSEPPSLLCRRLTNVNCSREFGSYSGPYNPHPDDAGHWPIDLSGYNDSQVANNYIQCPGGRSEDIIKQPEVENCCNRGSCNGGPTQVLDSGLRETGNYKILVWAGPSRSPTCSTISQVAGEADEEASEFAWYRLFPSNGAPNTSQEDARKTYSSEAVWAVRNSQLQALQNQADLVLGREWRKVTELLRLYSVAVRQDDLADFDQSEEGEMLELPDFTNPIQFYNSHSHVQSRSSYAPYQDVRNTLHLGMTGLPILASGGIEAAIHDIGWDPMGGNAYATPANRSPGPPQRTDSLHVSGVNRSIGYDLAAKRKLYLSDKLKETFEFSDGIPQVYTRQNNAISMAWMPNISQFAYMGSVEGLPSRTRLRRGPYAIAVGQNGLRDADPVGSDDTAWMPESGAPNNQIPESKITINKTEVGSPDPSLPEVTARREGSVEVPSRTPIAARQRKYFDDTRGTAVALSNIDWPQLTALMTKRSAYDFASVAFNHVAQPDPERRFAKDDYCLLDNTSCSGRAIRSPTGECVCRPGMAFETQSGQCECTGTFREYNYPSTSCVCGELSAPVSGSNDCACVANASPSPDGSRCACNAGFHSDGAACVANDNSGGGPGGNGGPGDNCRCGAGYNEANNNYYCYSPCGGSLGGPGGGGDDGNGGPGGPTCQLGADHCQCGGCCDNLNDTVALAATQSSGLGYNLSSLGLKVVSIGTEVEFAIRSDRTATNYIAAVAYAENGVSIPNSISSQAIAGRNVNTNSYFSVSYQSGAMNEITQENAEYVRRARFSRQLSRPGRTSVFATGLNIFDRPQAGDASRQIGNDYVVDTLPPQLRVGFDMSNDILGEYGQGFSNGEVRIFISGSDPIASALPSAGRNFSGNLCMVHARAADDPLVNDAEFIKQQCLAHFEDTAMMPIHFSSAHDRVMDWALPMDALQGEGSYFVFAFITGVDAMGNEMPAPFKSQKMHLQTAVNNCAFIPDDVEAECGACTTDHPGNICRGRPEGSMTNSIPSIEYYPEGFWNAWRSQTVTCSEPRPEGIPPDGRYRSWVDERSYCDMITDRIIDPSTGRLSPDTCEEIARRIPPFTSAPASDGSYFTQWTEGGCVMVGACESKCGFWEQRHFYGGNSGGGDPLPNNPCETDADCSTGFVCEARVSDGVKQCVPGWRDCDSNSDCASGHCDTIYRTCTSGGFPFCGRDGCGTGSSCQTCRGSATCAANPGGGSGGGGSGSSGFSNLSSGTPGSGCSGTIDWDPNTCSWNCNSGGGGGIPTKEGSKSIPSKSKLNEGMGN